MIFNKHNFSIVSLVPKGNNWSNHDIVHVTEKETEVTNGHYAVRVSVPDMAPDWKKDLPSHKTLKPFHRKRLDITISRDTADAVLKSIPNTNGAASLLILKHAWIGDNTNDKQVEFITTDLEVWRPVMAMLPEKKFPDLKKLEAGWRLRKHPKNEIGINPEYMAKICAFMARAGVKVVRFATFEGGKPIRITGSLEETGQDITVYCMPVKLDDTKFEEIKKKSDPDTNGADKVAENAAIGDEVQNPPEEEENGA